MSGVCECVAVLGGGITCVQCTPADPRCESGNLEPTECDDTHSYCGMYRVFMGECKSTCTAVRTGVTM